MALVSAGGEHRPQAARASPGHAPHRGVSDASHRGLRPNQLSAVSIKLHLIPHLLMDKINRMVYNDTNRFISYCVRQKEAPWSAGIRSITIWISQKLLPGGAPACAVISARSSSRMIPSSPPAMWAPPAAVPTAMSCITVPVKSCRCRAASAMSSAAASMPSRTPSSMPAAARCWVPPCTWWGWKTAPAAMWRPRRPAPFASV